MSIVKISLLSPIDPSAIDRLSVDHEIVDAVGLTDDELEQAIADSEILVARSGVRVSEELLGRASTVRLVIRAGSGLDNLDLEYMRRAGIRVVRVPGPGARAVAELTFGLILAVGRRIVEADQLMRLGHWKKHELAGRLLAQSVLGVVGLGNIGSTVGELAVAWGMPVIGCDIATDDDSRTRIRDLGILQTSFDEVVSTADIVSVHVPLLPTTRHLIDRPVLARMKRGAILVNIARGGIVDESALVDALRSGHLGGAALDVHEHEGSGISPLADLPNVVLTPHIGAMAVESQRLIGERIIEFIGAFERGDLDPVLGARERVL